MSELPSPLKSVGGSCVEPVIEGGGGGGGGDEAGGGGGGGGDDGAAPQPSAAITVRSVELQAVYLAGGGVVEGVRAGTRRPVGQIAGGNPSVVEAVEVCVAAVDREIGRVAGTGLADTRSRISVEVDDPVFAAGVEVGSSPHDLGELVLENPNQVVLARRRGRGRAEAPRCAAQLLQLGIGGDADPAIEGAAGTDQAEGLFLRRAKLETAVDRRTRRQCAGAGRAVADEYLGY